jgi:hypothetical protein
MHGQKNIEVLKIFQVMENCRYLRYSSAWSKKATHLKFPTALVKHLQPDRNSGLNGTTVSGPSNA